LKVVTYHSTNAPPEMAWLAFVILPNGTMWLVRSHGATEEEASERIERLYQKEINRFSKQANVDAKKKDVGSTDAEAVPKPAADQRAAETPAAKGQSFSGTAWVIHEVTREKRRVPGIQLEQFLNDGWVRCGPRTR